MHLLLNSKKIFFLFSLLPFVAFSHHSTSEFDRSVVTEVRGKVVNMLWKNPHVVLEVETVEGDPSSIWLAEGGSISGQRRRGVGEDNVNCLLYTSDAADE